MRVGTSYTKVVDMWALGVVVHELMTSEIPFLDTFQGLESMTITPEMYTVGTSNYPPMLDAELLMDYCRGSEFPTECLQRKGVSEEGITFVKSLMVADPRRRPTATVVLNSPWLLNLERTTTLRTQFGLMSIDLSHECVGQLLVEKDPTMINKMLHSPSRNELRAMTFTAISLGALEVLTILLKVTYNINFISEPDYISLIQSAAGLGKPAVIKFLLENGENVSKSGRGNRSQTALHEAARGGHLAAINLLLDHKAAINGSGDGDYSQTALHAAAASGHLDAMNLLLTRGADTNIGSDSHNGQMPLHAAAAGGNLEAIKLLLDHGGDIDRSAPTGAGQTALHGAASGGHLDAINLLLDRGADINWSACSHHGQTALHGAIVCNRLDAIKLLLDRGASVNLAAITKYGQLPLYEAARYGKLGAMELLLQHGANVEESLLHSPTTTALYGAARGGHIDAVKLLLDWGAVVNGPVLSVALNSEIHKLLEYSKYTQRSLKPSRLRFPLVPRNSRTPTGNGSTRFGSW